jgi:hypothetical protein
MGLRARVSPPHGAGCGRELEGSAAPEYSRVRASAKTLFTAAVSLADPYAAAGRYDDVIDLTEGLKNGDDASALLLTYRGMALRQRGFHDGAWGCINSVLGVGRRISDIARRSDGAVRVTRRPTSEFFAVIRGASALRSACKSR